MFLKRILTVLLLVLAFLLATACENVEYKEETSVESEASKNIYEQLEESLPDLPEESDGEVEKREFIIVTDKKTVYSNEEEVSGSLSKAIDKRNTFLYDKYGAEIKVIEAKPAEITNALKESLQAGTRYCDMVSISAKETVKLMNAGLLGDMNQLPGFNGADAYFDEKNGTALATNSTLYLLADPTAQYFEEEYVMFYNRDIVEKAGVKSPETLALQGKWNWDSFNEVARAAAPRVYEHSTSDITTDTFALGAYYGEGVFSLVMWTGSGSKMIKDTYKSPVTISMEIENVQTVAKTLRDAYNTRGRLPLDGEEVANAFKNDRLAFMVHKFSYFYTLRNENGGEKYGFLPIPKLDETQEEYNCLLSEDSRVIAIPKTTEAQSFEHKRFVSAVISATCATGRETVKQAFVNEHIGTYLYDNEETVLLQMLLDSATFDFAYIYGSVIGEVRRPTKDAIADYIEFGSALNSSISRALPAFNKYSAEKFK